MELDKRVKILVAKINGECINSSGRGMYVDADAMVVLIKQAIQEAITDAVILSKIEPDPYPDETPSVVKKGPGRPHKVD